MTFRLVFLFPGQGSQRVGMGASVRQLSKAATELYDRASDILGYDLASLCEHGPMEHLSRTDITQPALYVTSCAYLAALQEATSLPKPSAVAGHSVGEYAALYAAGAWTFETGLELVRARGSLMHEAASATPGGMAAILGLSVQTVEECCAEAASAGVVVVANDNCPGQVVISGELAAVEAALAIARQKGAKRAVQLAVSGGFHSPLMQQAAAALGAHLQSADIRNAAIPVVSNVTADYCRSASDIRTNLQDQVAGRVRWRESMLRLVSDGLGPFVEVGVGEVLTGLMKRTEPSAVCITMQDVEAAIRAIEQLGSRPLEENEE